MVSVTPVTAAVGAELGDVDLSRPLEPGTVKEIEAALTDHLVVFFRDQRIDDRQQRDFAAHFGPLQRFPFLDPFDPALPEVHAIATDASRPKTSNADIWHSDATFMSTPPLGSVLRAVELPTVGGDTLFASMYAAYEALSSRMQRLLEGLTAVHDFTKSTSHRKPLQTDYPPVRHPVVRTHPVSGRKGLFVNRIFTTRLDELSDRENDLVMPFLFDHVLSPDFQCRFHWRPGSIAFWDNRCTQHYAVADYTGRRVMHRVIIEGDEPV